MRGTDVRQGDARDIMWRAQSGEAALDPIHLDDQHRLIRDQLRRFVTEEVKPHGEAWEEAGMIPREVLRRFGGARLLRPAGAGGAWRRGARRHRLGGPGRGARALHLRRLLGHGPGPHRHGLAPPLPRRQRGADRALRARPPEREDRERHRRYRGRGGLGRTEPAHHGPALGQRLGARGHQDVHHQRRPRQPPVRGRANGYARQALTRHVHVHRRDRYPRREGRAQAQEDGLALLRLRRSWPSKR